MDVPLSMLLLLCLIFLIIGAALMLILQYYIYMQFSMLPEETAEQKDINAKYSLPSSMQQAARALRHNASAPSVVGGSGAISADVDAAPLAAINFIMQFLFHELKNTNRVRKWFYRKLSLELDELIAKTTTGKLFDKLTIKELELGDQFPEIRMLRVHNVELNDAEGRIENLDLFLELHYRGNFRTSIDADMVLGKKGSLTLKVKQLSGLARLQFTRMPYTHWSLSFLGDPELELAIESRYQGRQMQANITSLISNQIRKAVRRKHTLPNYKLRYKPFFHKTAEEDGGDGDIQPNGLLEVKVSELSRLMSPAHIADVYCTLTLASLAFVEAHQKDDRNVIISLDVEIHKAKNQQIGIVFKQSPEQNVEIETVLPNTPAFKSNLRSGDVLLAIEGKRISSIQQVAKVIKGLNSNVFRLRIERVIPGIIRNDAILEDLELYEDLGDLHTGYGHLKPSEPDVSVKQLVARNSSAERGTSSESSLNNTPTSSPKKSKLIAKALKKTISRENSENTKDEEARAKARASAKVDEKPKTPVRQLGEGVNDVEHYYQHSTIDCPLSRLIHMEDLSTFKLDAHCKFLNICVYGKCIGESTLLGFVNIPINQILADCCETSLTQCWKTFELNPPIPQDLKTHILSSQSGFNPNLCFGDLLCAFTWNGNPNVPINDAMGKQQPKERSKTPSQYDDSGLPDNWSAKSFDTSGAFSTLSQPRAHNFIRTHFQRAIQCDYCGKKIWLKDAVQCRECSMSCHKKCVTKCQNSTVCGPVDCSNVLPQSSPNISSTPEFMVTEPGVGETSECEEAFTAEDEQLMSKPAAGLEVHRASLTGLLAEGIKRVNSANNLAIPGIVSSFASGSSGSTTSNAKSLPPSPQRSPSRKTSLVNMVINPFELVTHRLEALPSTVTSLTLEQINTIAEPIINIQKDEDVMTMAKNASKRLYSDEPATERVNKINIMLSKLRLALDSETASHSTLTGAAAGAGAGKNGGGIGISNPSSTSAAGGVASSTESQLQKQTPTRVNAIERSEERVQALSVIMLYLCTGLQHAQGVAN